MQDREPRTAQLLMSWHQGDSKSLEALVEKHLPWIRAHVHNRIGPLLRNKGETGDYVQDAMVEFLRYGPRFVINNDAQFRALIVKVVENSLRTNHRKFTAARRAVARERPLPPTTILSLERGGISDKTPSQSAERHEREAWIRLAMELIPPESREALVLRLWQQLSFAEMGERLGIEPNAASMRHHRAIRRLAAKIHELRRNGVSAALD